MEASSKLIRACVLLSGAGMILAGTAGAAEKEPTDLLKDALSLPGLSAPDNLAAGALSIGPDDVKPISTSSELGSSLITGIGPDGKLKGAFGVSFSPFALGASIDLQEYKGDVLAQWIARSNFSTALSQAEAGEGNGSVAIGFQTVLFDRGDMLLRREEGRKTDDRALDLCFSNALKEIEQLPPPPPTSGDWQQDGEANPAIVKAYSSCVGDLQKSTWNDSSAGFGVVTVARATGNKATDLNQSNMIAYLSFSYGFEGLSKADEVQVDGSSIKSKCGNGFHWSCNAQVIVKFKYESDAAYDLPTVGAASAETRGVGIKFLAGNERTISYAYYRQEEARFSFGKRDLHEWGLGIETKIGEKTWINVVAGRKDDDIRGNENTVKIGFSWDVTNAAALLNPFAK